MKKTSFLLITPLAVFLTAIAIAQNNQGGWQQSSQIRHVLLISVDGLHAVDFLNCSQGIAGVNNDEPYCPHLAALGTTGINYVAASTSKPSDSFPGLMNIVTGATPRTMGIDYDVAYDRSLDAPAPTTGNGLAGAPCTANAAPTGTTTEYEEGIDIDQTKLNGGAPGAGLTDGGIAPSILRAWYAIPKPAARRSIPGTSYGQTRSSVSFTPRVATPPGRTSTPRIRL